MGRSSVPTMLSRVDFPQPEGPMTATNSPREIERSISCMASVRTVSVVNSLQILLSCIRFVWVIQI